MGICLKSFAVVDKTGEDDDAEHQEKDEQRQFFSRRFERVNLSSNESIITKLLKTFVWLDNKYSQEFSDRESVAST